MAKKSNDNQDRYQKAFDIWEERIGTAKRQAFSWRLSCLLCLIIILLLLVVLFSVITSKKNYVYVAEIKPGQSVVNMVPLAQSYSPTTAQKEYFVSQFIQKIMSLSVDPVLVKKNWLDAYSFVAGKAVAQLNVYAQKNKPLALLGQATNSVLITGFNPIGNNSYDFSWTQKSYDNSGRLISLKLYNGIFTVVSDQVPDQIQSMMNNPFGLKIVYLSMTQQGAA